MPLLLLVLLPPSAGCRRRGAGGGQPSAPTTAGDRAAQPRAKATGSPRSRADLPTTDAAIAMGNFDGRLVQMSRRMEGGGADAGTRPPPPSGLAALGGLYLTRGRILGRIADYEHGDALTERALREAPAQPDTLLARASARATFHRWGEALALLDEAAQRGARASAVDAARASIFEAQWRFAEARAVREREAARLPGIESLGALAALDGDEGRLDEAERHFAEALDAYRDVSPFPVAWLWLSQGTMWQREGRPARARELLEAAHERLPQLAPAAGHLAALELAAGELAGAEARLRRLLDTSDDPEYVGQLAQVLRRKGAGAQAEADALVARARARYEALLAAHPEAFADHAARFFLDVGGDPKRAHALAARHEQETKSAAAAQLVVDAATAAGDPAGACDAAERMVARAPRSEPLLHAAWKALTACGRSARADEVLRMAALPRDR